MSGQPERSSTGSLDELSCGDGRDEVPDGKSAVDTGLLVRLGDANQSKNGSAIVSRDGEDDQTSLTQDNMRRDRYR